LRDGGSVRGCDGGHRTSPTAAGRFEVVATNPHVVVDYAHSPDALRRTCATARELASMSGGKLTVVFGAGGNRDPAKRPFMGKAARSADRVILTTDNPRDEDPAAIAAAVALGLTLHQHVDVELDRQTAIARAVREEHPSDVVLVCGKGHETVQVAAGTAQHFSDKEAVLEVLSSRR
jgi:UDP-N-acetylmuramoyl-L-alanyl-D-glutamate--2,6-diaminopimelate ligase